MGIENRSWLQPIHLIPSMDLLCLFLDAKRRFRFSKRAFGDCAPVRCFCYALMSLGFQWADEGHCTHLSPRLLGTLQMGIPSLQTHPKHPCPFVLFVCLPACLLPSLFFFSLVLSRVYLWLFWPELVFDLSRPPGELCRWRSTQTNTPPPLRPLAKTNPDDYPITLFG